MYHMDLDLGFCAWVYCKDWAPQCPHTIEVWWDSGKGICLPNSPGGPTPPGLDAAGSADLLNSSFLVCVLIQHVEELNETFLMGAFNVTFITSWENTLIISLLVNGRRRETTLYGWRQYAAELVSLFTLLLLIFRHVPGLLPCHLPPGLVPFHNNAWEAQRELLSLPFSSPVFNTK